MKLRAALATETTSLALSEKQLRVPAQLLPGDDEAAERWTFRSDFFAIRPLRLFCLTDGRLLCRTGQQKAEKVFGRTGGLTLLVQDSGMEARGIHERGGEFPFSEILSSRFLTGVADWKGQM